MNHSLHYMRERLLFLQQMLDFCETDTWLKDSIAKEEIQKDFRYCQKLLTEEERIRYERAFKQS